MSQLDPGAAPAARGWGNRLEDWLRHGWPAVAALLGTVAVGVASTPELIEGLSAPDTTRSFLIGHWGWPQWVFVVGIFALVSSVIGQFVNAPSVNEMAAAKGVAESSAQSRAVACEQLLKAIASDLEKRLALHNSTTRLSVYSHANGYFSLLTRVSANPTFLPRGRSKYPDNQGIIGQAWQAGFKVKTGLEENREQWEAQLLEAYDIPRSVSALLKMQSRSLVAKRIESPGEHRPLGMLVVESTTARGVSSSTVDDIEANHAWDILRHALAASESELPDLAEALSGALAKV